jgi:hypothetical protein
MSGTAERVRTDNARTRIETAIVVDVPREQRADCWALLEALDEQGHGHDLRRLLLTERMIALRGSIAAARGRLDRRVGQA